MSWIGLVYYDDEVDKIGGTAVSDTEQQKEIKYKVQKYVKRGCKYIDIYRCDQTIFSTGIKMMKRVKGGD